MKYYIIAGEASGDLHGSNLVKSIFQKDPDAEIRAWGGDLMKSEGTDVVMHISQLAFMGFWEVITNLHQISKNFKFCRKDVIDWQPDVLVMIDFPGFNLKLVKWFKERNIKIVYYISPQVWAWKAKRVKDIKLYVDRLVVILPFEKEYYAERDVEVDYVGHPLLDCVADHDDHKIKGQIALIPGSRKQEIKTMLPVMLQAASAHPECTYKITQAPGMPEELYTEITSRFPALSCELVQESTYKSMAESEVALVTSGTATLETALHNTPQVVCYKGNWISYWIARSLVNVKYISLVNLILDEPLLTELIQGDLDKTRLSSELTLLLEDKEQNRQKEAYSRLKDILANKGASERTADIVIDYAQRS